MYFSPKSELTHETLLWKETRDLLPCNFANIQCMVELPIFWHWNLLIAWLISYFSRLSFINFDFPAGSNLPKINKNIS